MASSASRTATTSGETERIVGFSDAVFAIAITFLALGLKLDVDVTSDNVGHFLWTHTPNYLTYGFCFLVVGYQWWQHHHMFQYIRRERPLLRWLNILMLAFVAVVPYPTTILGNNLQLPLAIQLFDAVVIAMSLLMWGMWELAVRKRHLVDPGLSRATIVYVRARLLVTPAVFGISFLLAFASTHAALASWVLLLFSRLVVHRMQPDEDERFLQSPPEDGPQEAPDADASETRSRSLVTRVREGSDKDRMVAFSDAVYAIAATIVALIFRAPDHAVTSQELATELLDQQQTLLAFLITFWMIGTFWSVHCQLFAKIVGTDSPLLWLNLLNLLVIAFLPFPTEVVETFGPNRVVVSLYLLTLLLSQLTLNLIWYYAAAGKRLVDPALTARELRGTYIRGSSASGIFAVALIVALIPGGARYSLYTLLSFIILDRVLDRFFPDIANDTR